MGKRQRKKNFKVRLKVTELKQVPKSKHGKVKINNPNLESHEKKTVFYLARYGFNIEVLMPSNMPGTNNPDLLMMGTFWEMKAPISSKKSSISDNFFKAVKQSGGKTVFDLRNIKKKEDVIEAEKNIMELFKETRGMRRIILIKKSGKTIDIIK